MAKTPTRPATPVKAEVAPQGLRFRADGFASLRKKFGLSAVQMAQLLGVSNQSVYQWEAGKSKLRAAQRHRGRAQAGSKRGGSAFGTDVDDKPSAMMA